MTDTNTSRFDTDKGPSTETSESASPATVTSQRASSSLSAAELYRAASRILNHVPHGLTENEDGSVFFIVELGDDEDTDDVVEAVEAVTLRDSDGDTIVVETQDGGEDYALVIRDQLGTGNWRYMLLNLRCSFMLPDGGIVEVTVLPAGTTVEEANALVRALEWREPGEESDEDSDAQDSELPLEVPAEAREEAPRSTSSYVPYAEPVIIQKGVPWPLFWLSFISAGGVGCMLGMFLASHAV